MNKLLMAILLSTSLFFIGCQSQEAASIGIKDLELNPAVVVRVVDGDTVELNTGEKVRLIGINTPETTKEHEPYGEEAKKYTRKMLEGKSVYLENDISETDQYGRLLKYVWLIDEPEELNDYIEHKEQFIRDHMFNAILLNGGYAEPYTFPPDTKYADLFKDIARDARFKERGLWSFDPIYGTTRGDLDDELYKNKQELERVNELLNQIDDEVKNPDESSGPAVAITELNKKAEFIVITNRSSADFDLSDWKILSTRGGQTYTFPSGYILHKGKSVKVGGYDAKEQCDLVWENEGGVWSNSKSDPAELYDAEGNLISRFDQ